MLKKYVEEDSPALKKIQDEVAFEHLNRKAAAEELFPDEQLDEAFKAIKRKSRTSKHKTETEAIQTCTYQVLKVFFINYQKNNVSEISRLDRLTSHIENQLSNYKHKKNTEEWIKDKVTGSESKVLSNIKLFLRNGEYILPTEEGSNKISHNTETIESTVAAMAENPKLLKQQVKAFFLKAAK